MKSVFENKKKKEKEQQRVGEKNRFRHFLPVSRKNGMTNRWNRMRGKKEQNNQKKKKCNTAFVVECRIWLEPL